MASLNDIETKVNYIIDLLDARTIKTITGVLPITFTTTEDKLRDWEISGNDDVYEGQQGVGERTENLMPSAVNGTYTSGRGTVTCNDGKYHFHVSEGEGSVNIIIPIPEFTLPVSVGQGGNGQICYFNSIAESAITCGLRYGNTSIISYSMMPVNRVLTNYGESSAKQCDTLQFYAASGVTEVDIDIAPCIVIGAAPTTFVPYGYEIPISVNGTQQTFYIGNSPLTAGQSISKTSTGVDIATTEGENTISTTLYNKPEMTIKYK